MHFKISKISNQLLIVNPVNTTPQFLCDLSFNFKMLIIFFFKFFPILISIFTLFYFSPI